MKKGEVKLPEPKKYNPFSAANIALEALAAEAHKRGTTYGKLAARLTEEEKQQIIQAYREARHA